MTLDARSIARALNGEVFAGRVLAPGPGHSAKDRSLSVKVDPDAPDGFLVTSFAGDDPIVCKDHVRQRCGLPAWKANGKSNGVRVKRDHVVATYVYRQADGVPYLRVQRTAAKVFWQSHWDGKTWIKGKPKGPKIPYLLSALIEFPGDPVYIVEGEKDADRLASLDLVATTSSEGAGKWTTDLNEYFRGRTVYVIPDNDELGREHARKVADNLRGVAASVAIIELPGLPPKGDVSNWLDVGNSVEDLPKMAQVEPPSGEAEPTSPPLQWLDMPAWDVEPVPERKWAIKDRVPLNQAGLFSGEGGTGKSIIELMKNVAHVAGKDWMGSLPEQGPAFYVGAEDDKDEIHIRLADIAGHYGVTFEDLTKGGLKVLCLLGQDATLCAAGKSGRIETTGLYKQLYEAAGDIKPKNISIDTLSRAFAGNEIDRVQVYAFAQHMQALAMVAGGSVTVLSHPSLQGINNGSGISGSTAWHGAFRFRQYLKGVKATEGEQPNGDLRELQFLKNQYGPLGETIVLRYQRGLFLPEIGMSNLDKVAREAKVDAAFLFLLARFTEQGRNVSEKPNANSFAPTIFAKEEAATKHGIRKADLEGAMRRLFASNKIHVEPYGKPCKGFTRLAPKA
jgi:RecA-family ATPase